MNVLLFAKSEGLAEQRIAEFKVRGILRIGNVWKDRPHVHVVELIGLEHDPCSPSFDCVRLNLSQLLAAGITELRLEVEA